MRDLKKHIFLLLIVFIFMIAITFSLVANKSLEFENFYFLLPGVVVCLGYIVVDTLYRIWKKKTIDQVSLNSQIRGLAFPSLNMGYNSLSFLALFPLITFFTLFLSLGNPFKGKYQVDAYKQSSRFSICLDISYSMDAVHNGTSRLDLAKKVIQQLTKNLEGNEFELILFSDQAIRYIPATNDVHSVDYFLENVSTSFSSNGSTSFESLETYFDERKDLNKKHQVILISDGEGFKNINFPADMVVHTIGLGAGTNDKIPYYRNGEIAGYKKTPSGSTVKTRSDPDALKPVSSKSGGMHFTVDRPQTNFLKLSRTLLRSPEEKKKTDFSNLPKQKHYIIGVVSAISLLILIVVMLWKKWF